MAVVIFVLETTSAATTILLTQNLGAQSGEDSCNEVATVGLSVSALFSILIGLILLFLPHLLFGLLRPPAEAFAGSCLYLKIVGGTVLIAQYGGAHKFDEQRKTIGTLLTLYMLVAVAFTIIMLLFGKVLLDILGTPQVAYKETITKLVDQETKYARQSGGKGQYGHVKIKLEPNESGKGYEFINATVGGSIPKEYIEPVNKGIQGALNAGVVAGYPVVDVKVTLYDGSYHEVDSSEMAFMIAGSMAFKEAMRKANPVLLEPIMSVEITVPDQYLGDVMGDVSKRRGQLQRTTSNAGVQIINAQIPLAEMFGYISDLRSKTQGLGDFSMEPSHYAEVPRDVAENIIGERAKKQ